MGIAFSAAVVPTISCRLSPDLLSLLQTLDHQKEKGVSLQ